MLDSGQRLPPPTKSQLRTASLFIKHQKESDDHILVFIPLITGDGSELLKVGFFNLQVHNTCL